MSHWNLFKGGVALAALAAATSAPVYAQVTSSNLNGQVSADSGQAVSGAAVSIVYEPTGKLSTATTSANGVFFQSGLQVGGPYTISVTSADGTAEVSDIYLKPGAGNSVALTIGGQRTLDVITVIGTVAASADLNNGVGSAFSARDILDQPSTERDLMATLNRDPLSFSGSEGQLSVAGANPRFNALSIDGSLQGDDFGLSSSTYATARAPISLDAVESVSVSATDYSVTNSGFTGGLVNVVTKSGTNEWDGSVYYYKQDEDYYGNAAFGDFVDVAAFDEKEYGFTVGGPIIEDKLFFFGSYDKFETGRGASYVSADANNDVDPQIYSEINSIVNSVYGFDMGGRPTTVSLPESSERYLGKIDWNINQNHRASFTYQQTEETGVFGTGSTNFQSAYYASPKSVKAYTGQLFSDWTDAFSTELRVNYKEFSKSDNCYAGQTIGEWDIRLSEQDLIDAGLPNYLDDGDGVVESNDVLYLTGGCDIYRQGNTFDDTRLQVFGAGNYIWGDHFISFGGEFENYELDNLYAQRSVGEFVFNSITDLQNQVANVSILLPDTGDAEDIRAVWGYNKIALFAQDSWQVLPELRLDYGLRYETFDQSDAPQERTFFEAAYGFPNTSNLDGIDLLMPRIGFEYTPFDRTTVKGGLGLFAGGDPKVWTSAAFTPPVFYAAGTGLTGVNPASGTPASLLAAITAFSANDPGPIDIIDPDFETPSDWKASLKVDQLFDLDFSDYGFIDLGTDYLVSGQLLYTQTNKGFLWQNLPQLELPTGVAPDGRPIYANLQTLGVNNAIMLTNYDEGESLVWSLALSKDYDNGLGFSASYAHQDVDSVTPGTSSRGVSNFRSIIDFDRNYPSAYTAPYEIEHAFKLNLNYETEIFGNLESKFNLFGQFYSGEPFSYTFDVGSSNPLFGRQGNSESPYDNDLLYVPMISGTSISDPSVVLGSKFDEQGFIDYVKANGMTPGSIQDRNAGVSTWNQRWDFQWQQELPIPGIPHNDLADHRLNFVVDIKNVANLLNDEWGTMYSGPGYDELHTVTADIVSAADVTANGVDAAAALTGDAPRTTCMSAGDCLYRFNNFDNDSANFERTFDSVYQVRIGLRYEF